ncbi:O-antigen polymerase [Caldibacillus thermoamylovorans]|uniref:O-antigen polymerase n=1 Tax=Caldibacillus thermoamylovorans TaxID=35841 RepID=UPI0022DF5C91|nr:O-antigen polymerase [Caldibacillus thermoamylovorans]
MKKLYIHNIKYLTLITAIIIGSLSVLLGNVMDSKYLAYLLFLLIAFSIIIFGVFSSYSTHGYIDILSPYVFFPMMYLVIYGVGPHKALGRNPEMGILVLNVIAGGFIAFIIGAMLMSSVLIKSINSSKYIDIKVNPFMSRHFGKISRIAFVIGIIAMLMFFINARGIPVLMSDLENSRIDALSNNGIPFYLSMLIMISVWVYFLSERKLSHKITFLIIGITLLLSTGWRNTAVALFLVSVLIYHYQRPIPFRKLVATGIILVVLISVTGLSRIYSSDLQNYKMMQMMVEGNYLQAFFAYLYNYPVVFTDNLILVLQGFSNPNLYLHGLSFIWNFGLIIPGLEIQSFDFYLKDYLGVGFAGGGLPPTLLGDFYLNFGLNGVLIGMMLMGMFWKYMHYLFMKNKRNLVGLSALIILYYLSVSIRGGIENITLTTTWLLIALYLLNILLKSRISK